MKRWEIGVISDTHGLVRPEALAALRGVDRIVHAGDIGSADVLARLETIAPVSAVRGNNDRGPWAEALPLTDVVLIGDVSLYLLHDLHELDLEPRAAGFAAVINGHGRGAKVVAQALRDAGVEVVYTGLKRTPEEIVQEAIQEDVDVIGLSILSGAHVPLSRRVLEGLRAQGADEIKVVVGGIIPPRDVAPLLAIGVSRVFPMGTPLPDVVRAFKETNR